MKKTNQKILSLPPYISTSWENIKSIHIKNPSEARILVITLNNNTMIDIPNLSKELIDHTFNTHHNYINQQSDKPTTPHKKNPTDQSHDLSFGFGLPFSLNNTETMTSFLQHDPNQSNAAPIPLDLIKKIMSITKSIGIDIETVNIPKGEPHCNCPYCQLSRGIHNQEPSIKTENTKESILPVSDEDLRFREWDVKQTSENLYTVSNPFNSDEHYQVFLGSPIGCTCGKKNCEHIRTVLNS